MLEAFENLTVEFHLRFTVWSRRWTHSICVSTAVDRGLVILEDFVAGNGVAEYASEEDVRREVGSQADAGKANGSR